MKLDFRRILRGKMATTWLCLIVTLVQYRADIPNLVACLCLNAALLGLLLGVERRKEWARRSYLVYWFLLEVPLDCSQFFHLHLQAKYLSLLPLDIADACLGAALAYLVCQLPLRAEFTQAPHRPRIRLLLGTLSFMLGLAVALPPPQPTPNPGLQVWTFLDQASSVLQSNQTADSYSKWEKSFGESMGKTPPVEFFQGCLSSQATRHTALVPAAAAALLASGQKPEEVISALEGVLNLNDSALKPNACRVLLSPKVRIEDARRLLNLSDGPLRSSLDATCLQVKIERLDKDEVLEDLSKTLRSNDRSRRWDALQVLPELSRHLSRTDMEPLATDLLAILQKPPSDKWEEQEHATTLETLAKLKSANPGIEPEIVAQLNAKSEMVMASAINALVSIDPHHPEVLSTLKKQLGSLYWWLRRNALLVTQKLGPEAAPLAPMLARRLSPSLNYDELILVVYALIRTTKNDEVIHRRISSVLEKREAHPRSPEEASMLKTLSHQISIIKN